MCVTMNAVCCAQLTDGDRFYQFIVQYGAHGIQDKDAVARIMRFQNMSCYFTHTLAGPDFDGRTALINAVVNHGARFRYVMGHLPFGWVHGGAWVGGTPVCTHMSGTHFSSRPPVMNVA